jgi:hypothetical protein
VTTAGDSGGIGNIETSIVPSLAGFDHLAAAARDAILLVPVGVEAPSREGRPFASSLPTVLKLAKASGVPMAVHGSPASPALLERRSSEWFGPAMFISSLFLSDNQNAVSLAISMLANYLTTLFSGKPGASVSLDIYIGDTETRETTKVTYRGPVDGIHEIQGVIEAARRKKGR